MATDQRLSSSLPSLDIALRSEGAMLKPLPFVWPYAILFWIVELWAFFPEFRVLRNAKRSGNKQDAKSLQVILMGLNVAFFAAFWLAWMPWLQIVHYRIAVYYIGVGLMIAGSLLRRHCFRMLGQSFTGDVRASADQVVVTRGAYSLLRHPSYTAAIILNIGVALALGSWLSLAVLIVTSFLVYGYRISVEERALVTTIGEPYRQFMSSRKRLIPFVY
jgi:protein-S-isoprenylcysteine O-methyltransferase Ste14